MNNEITKQKKCNSCRTLIDVEANVCPSCQRNQKFFTKDIFYTPNFLTVISLLISVVLLALSFMEFFEVKRERKETTLALKKADSSMFAANLALDQALITKVEIERAELTILEVSIRNYNKVAFEKLLVLQSDTTYAYHKTAKEIVFNFFSYFSKVNPYLDYANMYSGLDLNAEELLNKDSYLKFDNLANDSKLIFISTISNWYPAKYSIPFLIEILKRNDDLRIVGYASESLVLKFNLNYHPMEYSKVINWWGKNKINIITKNK